MMIIGSFFMLYVPVNKCLVMSELIPVFLGQTSTKQRINCHTQPKETTQLVTPLSLKLASLLTLYQLSHCAPQIISYLSYELIGPDKDRLCT